MEKIGLDLNETLKAVPVGRSTIYAAVASGELPAYKCGRRIFFKPEDLKAYVDRMPRAQIGRKRRGGAQ